MIQVDQCLYEIHAVLFFILLMLLGFIKLELGKCAFFMKDAIFDVKLPLILEGNSYSFQLSCFVSMSFCMFAWSLYVWIWLLWYRSNLFMYLHFCRCLEEKVIVALWLASWSTQTGTLLSFPLLKWFWCHVVAHVNHVSIHICIHVCCQGKKCLIFFNCCFIKVN